MVENKNHYSQNVFMGAAIKCSDTYLSLTRILEALYVLVYETGSVYRYPRGFHVRVRFTDKMTIRTFSARLSTYYRRKSGYVPVRLTVEERDEGENSTHHHLAIILNDKTDRRQSLQYFLGKLWDGGFLADYKVVCPDSDAYGHQLQTLEDRDSYFKWMTYLAKVETKPSSGQVWSCCRTVSRALKVWRSNQKPDLRMQFRAHCPEEKSAGNELFLTV